MKLETDEGNPKNTLWEINTNKVKLSVKFHSNLLGEMEICFFSLKAIFRTLRNTKLYTALVVLCRLRNF